MKIIYFIFSLVFILSIQEAIASRTMYVDNFSVILGDVPAENSLLAYAQTHDIDALILYELHIVNAIHDLANPASNFILANFISKAKTTYGIMHISATAENSDFFTNVIDAYNNTRNSPDEKFDIYNLEFEYWSVAATGPGGYYCTTYLTPNGYSCTVNGAFQFYTTILDTMNYLADNNSHPITTEAYVGWTNAGQADTIGANVDRVLLHAYVSDPNTAFGYSENRLIDFANGNPGLDVSILYSTEPNFMQNWLVNNSMEYAEEIFTSDWLVGSSSWSNNINLEGFTYYVYSFMTNITLPIELNFFKGYQTKDGIRISWETEGNVNTEYFDIERSLNGKYFYSIGQIETIEQKFFQNIYSFFDNKPFVGENFFRLKMVDIDGEFEYSNIVQIDYSNQPGFYVYPSLVNDFVNIRSSKMISQVIVYDIFGKMVKSTIFNPTKVKKISLLDLPVGNYLIRIISKSDFNTQRIVKIH